MLIELMMFIFMRFFVHYYLKQQRFSLINNTFPMISTEFLQTIKSDAIHFLIQWAKIMLIRSEKLSINLLTVKALNNTQKHCNKVDYVLIISFLKINGIILKAAHLFYPAKSSCFFETLRVRRSFLVLSFYVIKYYPLLNFLNCELIQFRWEFPDGADAFETQGFIN